MLREKDPGKEKSVQKTKTRPEKIASSEKSWRSPQQIEVILEKHNAAAGRWSASTRARRRNCSIDRELSEAYRSGGEEDMVRGPCQICIQTAFVPLFPRNGGVQHVFFGQLVTREEDMKNGVQTVSSRRLCLPDDRVFQTTVRCTRRIARDSDRWSEKLCAFTRHYRRI